VVDAVERACRYLERRAGRVVTLREVAGHVGMSPSHLQRTFSERVGVSPRAYHEALRARRFRRGLRGGEDVAGATYAAGYGSAGRVYERRPTGGMTPAAYRRGGADTEVRYVVVPSPLGRLLVAGTPRGVCAVKLGDTRRALEDNLRREYPEAAIARGSETFREWVEAVVAHLEGRAPRRDLPLDVRGTAFQWTVWRHLQSIPYGATESYSEVARRIGAPTAVRAVARACATNPVCLVVPCHRVVQKDGGLGGYRWGLERKRALLDREARRR
jgi:AraC family transcriptional regulator of adaptative response/methylated-DNA-[protein]-cysteine methyltransferase